MIPGNKHINARDGGLIHVEIKFFVKERNHKHTTNWDTF